MAKTQFSTGSVLTPAWVDSIYGVGPTGGHVHDSADLNGHAHQINLTTEVAGILPQGNLPVAPSFTGGIRTDPTSVAGGSYLKWQTYTYVFAGTWSSSPVIDINLDVEAILPWASIRQVLITFSRADGTPYGFPGTGVIHYATAGIGSYPVIAYTVIQGTGATAHIFRLRAITDTAYVNDRLSIVILHV